MTTTISKASLFVASNQDLRQGYRRISLGNPTPLSRTPHTRKSGIFGAQKNFVFLGLCVGTSPTPSGHVVIASLKGGNNNEDRNHTSYPGLFGGGSCCGQRNSGYNLQTDRANPGVYARFIYDLRYRGYPVRYLFQLIKSS